MGIDSREAICNMALSFAGVTQTIDSIDEPTAAARACKVIYEQYKQDLFDDYVWPFAMRRRTLAAVTGPAWASGQEVGRYALNDIVAHAGSAYIANRANAVEPTGHGISADWSEVAVVGAPGVVWDALTMFDRVDWAVWGGVVYVSLKLAAGIQPGTDPTAWAPFGVYSGGVITAFTVPAWVAYAQMGGWYRKGDLVTVGATVYRALTGTVAAPNVNNDPRTSPVNWVKVSRDGYPYVFSLPEEVSQIKEVWATPDASQAQVTTYAQTPTPPIRAPRSEQRGTFRVESASEAVDGYDGLVMLSDIQNPTIHYIANIDNTLVYSHHFILSLAWKLAGPLCMALRADPRMAMMLEQNAARVLAGSIATEMRGERADPEPVSEFEASREG
jgi:hypothetical protein